MIFIKNHEVLTTEREPEGPAQRSNFRNEGIFLFASFAVIMIFIKNLRINDFSFSAIRSQSCNLGFAQVTHVRKNAIKREPCELAR